MTTSTEQLNDAITALQGAADAYNGKKGEIDAALAASQAGYNALSANLKSVVSNEMAFTATIDPNDANPTNVDGGIFNTVSEAINASPRGSAVTIFLPADTVHDFSVSVQLDGRNLLIRKSGAGSDPTLTFQTHVGAGANQLYGIGFMQGGTVRFADIDIVISDKADAGLPWHAQSHICQYSDGAVVNVVLDRSKVTGVDGRAVATCTNATMVLFAAFASELDGAIYGVANATAGAAVISRVSLTLTNGAAITQGGTVGTNIIQN